MTTIALSNTTVSSRVLPVVAAAIVGMALLFVGTISQAAVLHDASHDTRHAVVAPCH